MLEDIADPPAFQRASLGDRPFTGAAFLLQPALLVGDYELMRELLGREGEAVTAGWPKSTQALLGEHSIVVVADADKHRYLRRLIVPPLKQDAVDELLPELQRVIGGCLARWAREGDEGRLVVAHKECKRMTFEIITRLLLGPLEEAELGRMAQLFDRWLKGLFTPITIDSPPFVFHTSMSARRQLARILLREIGATRSRLQQLERQADSGDGNAAGTGGGDGAAAAAAPGGGAATVLERMMVQRDEGGQGLSDDELVDNLITMLFAGHDTSSSAMTTCLHLLATHPHVIERLRQEQRQVVARHGQQVTGAALRDSPYCDAVMREAMRLRPVVNAVVRQATQHMELQGHHVPQGMTVLVGLSTIQQRDKRFAGMTGPLAPCNFAPERFLGEEGRKPGGQAQFGMGNRTCPGMPLAQAEIMTMLALLARGYQYKADWNTTVKNFPMPRPANGLPMLVSSL